MDDVTRAYLAAYFDGEGSVGTLNWRSGAPPTIRLCFTQRDREALERIRDECGGGGTLVRTDSGSWNLAFAARDQVRHIIRAIYPFVRQKREHLRVAYMIAGLTGRRHGASRRVELAQELAILNLRGRSKPVANRHGSRAYPVAP